MAKQLVNPIERHVEKAILGLAGLALIAVIARYVVTTPNSLELGGERVTPGTIDQKVAQKAADVASRLKTARPAAAIPEPLQDDFAAALKPLEPRPLPVAVALAPEVPIIDRAGPMGGQATLVKVQPPAKPVISHGRSTLITAGQKLVDSDWVSVSAIFDMKARREAQKSEYGPKGEDVVLGPLHVQRRQRRPDGGWSEGDWGDVNCSPAFKLPPEPHIVLVDEGGKLTVDKDLLKQIEEFFHGIAAPKVQLEILRPMPPEMKPPTRWAMPVITAYRDVQKQDDELQFPNEAPNPDPLDRYGLSGAAAVKAPAKELTPEQQRAKNMDDAQKLLEQARKNESVNDAIRVQNMCAEIILDRTASATEKARAEKLKAEAAQLEKDIKRKEAMGELKPAGQQAAAGVAKREKLPIQQVWAHDAAVGSIENGATYQYRIRFRVYNVLAGAPTKFSNPEDAAVLFVESEWSEPSDPVTIEPAALFFVTSEDAKDQEISVEFFQWYMGVWLKPEGRIKAGIGNTLRDKRRNPAPALDDPTQLDRPEIEFTADATVVDIDFERPIRERKQGATPKGVRFADKPSATTSVVFMDSQGRLHERFVAVDKMDPAKRMTVWTPTKPKP